MASKLKNILFECSKSDVTVCLIVFFNLYLISTEFSRRMILTNVKPIIRPSNTSTIQEKSVTFKNKNANGRKIILFWNSFYNNEYFAMGVGNERFKLCPNFKNCDTTRGSTKSGYLNIIESEHIIDAVVFHGLFTSNDITAIQELKKERRNLKDYNQGIEPLFVLFLLVSKDLHSDVEIHPYAML